jgi:uncharacterized membrane protein
MDADRRSARETVKGTEDTAQKPTQGFCYGDEARSAKSRQRLVRRICLWPGGRPNAHTPQQYGENAMSYMDMQFPGDMHEASVRAGRNISDAERWCSMTAGAVLAVYGLSRRRGAGLMLAGLGALLARRGITGHCDTYQLLGINTAGTGSDTRRALSGGGGINVEESVTINRPVEELYRFWRKLDNLPRFMGHLESVESLTDTVSRWRAKGPAGSVVEWNAEIINEVPNQVIGWRSIEGSDVVSAGSVNFDDAGAGRGTRVRVRLQYSPPGGKLGAAVAKLMGRDPAAEIREDLRQFKQIVESGEVPTTKGQPRG